MSVSSTPQLCQSTLSLSFSLKNIKTGCAPCFLILFSNTICQQKYLVLLPKRSPSFCDLDLWLVTLRGLKMAYNKFLDVKLFLCKHFKTLVRQLVGTDKFLRTTVMLLTVCGFFWMYWFSRAKNNDMRDILFVSLKVSPPHSAYLQTTIVKN